MTRTRRRFLGTVAGATTVGVTGCLSGGQGSGGGASAADESDESAGEGSGDSNGDGNTLDTHPAATALDGQPRLGPPPGEAAGTIVAFEDPSCHRCRVFEEQTTPRIRSELVDPGDATLVFRGFPNVYPWGEVGLKALEATHARDADAHWALLDHYFDEQATFESEGREAVLPRTREFLAAETAVDADAVVTAVEGGEADAAVEADRAAGAEAGVNGTPAVFLFRDGEYRTQATGSVGFEFVTTALGL